MPDQNQEFYIIIVIGGVLGLLLVGFIVTILLLYQRKQHRQEQELARMKIEYEQEVLRSQLEIQENTLKVIAQELHDNIGQVLSVVKLSLAVLPLDQDHGAYGSVQHIREILNKAIFDLANLTKSMHTDRIAQVGLAESVRFELESLQRTGLLKIAFDIEGDECHLGEQKEIFIFRIFQELVNNILKHSRATQINTSLNYIAGDRFVMQIRDNGVGFDVNAKRESTSASSGVGLKSLFNRAKLIGGVVSINSRPGQGTTVKVELPLPEYAEEKI